MGGRFIRVAVLLGMLALWAWSSQQQGQASTPATPAAAVAGIATDDGVDWLPALVPAALLVAVLAVLLAVVCVQRSRPILFARVRTTRPRAPPAC